MEEINATIALLLTLKPPQNLDDFKIYNHITSRSFNQLHIIGHWKIFPWNYRHSR